MRALVVVAHPDPASLTHALAATAAAAFGDAGHHVDVLDLYALGSPAAMSVDERRAYHSATPVVDAMVAEHVALVRRADTLVFVYPTWWAGMPAIMKGWLERTMVVDVAFVFDEQHRVRPGLTHVRRLVGISTYGSRRAYVALMSDGGRRTITRALRVCTGWSTRTTWLGLYGVDATTAARREAFVARVDSTLRAL